MRTYTASSAISSIAALAAALLLAGACMFLAPEPAHADATGFSETASSSQGVVLAKEDGYLRCYKNGSAVTDKLIKIAGATYYFDSKGNAVEGRSVKVGSRYLIFGNSGKLLKGKKRYVKLKHGTYYVAKSGRPARTGWFAKHGRLRYVAKSGKVKTSGSKQGIRFSKSGYAKNDRASKLKLIVMRNLKKITKSSWSRSKKLAKCWKWCQSYGVWGMRGELNDITTKNGWIQREALITFRLGTCECFGGVCMLAAYAYELGYTDISVRALPNYHATLYINGREYNWADKPNMKGTPTVKMLNWRDTNWPKSKKKSKSARSGKTGWVEKAGKRYYYRSGKKLKSRWLTLAGKRYYLTSSGAAATGAKKVKGKWYVFGSKGVLKKGHEEHIVKVSGVRYRVKKTGRAAPGWNDAHTRYWLANGRQATGVCMAGGKVAIFSAKGVYKESVTKSARALVSSYKIGSDATELIGTLGTPKATKTSNTCRPGYEGGAEIRRTYTGAVLYTFRSADASSPELFAFIVARY